MTTATKTTAKTTAKTTQNPSLKKARPASWCLFEDHFFNTETKNWEPADPKNGLRPCRHSKCTRQHKLPNRPTKVCEHENDCLDANVTCFLLHDNTKIKPLCYYGAKCCDKECANYRHPRGRTRETCSLDDKCPEALITCFKLHTLSKITPICRYNRPDNMCKNYICDKRHSAERKPCCPAGSMCYGFITQGEKVCDMLHPKILQKLCRWDGYDDGCRSFGCPYVHHPEAPVDCPEGMQCQYRLERGTIAACTSIPATIEFLPWEMAICTSSEKRLFFIFKDYWTISP